MQCNFSILFFRVGRIFLGHYSPKLTAQVYYVVLLRCVCKPYRYLSTVHTKTMYVCIDIESVSSVRNIKTYNKQTVINIYTSKTKHKINYKKKFDFQETLKGSGIYLYDRSVNSKRIVLEFRLQLSRPKKFPSTPLSWRKVFKSTDDIPISFATERFFYTLKEVRNI